MSYFSDEKLILGINFEMLASEQDLIFFKGNSELLLMGMVRRLKPVLKDLRESVSLKEFREMTLSDGWSCCVSKTGSLHVFCYLQPVLDLSSSSVLHLIGLLQNHNKAYVIQFTEEKNGKICDCDFCDYNIFIWEHMDTFEKNGLKIKVGDKVTGKMLLEILEIQKRVFSTMHGFSPKRLEDLCMEKLGEEEQMLLPESVKYSTLRSTLSRDIPYLVHDVNHTACLVYGVRQKGLNYDLEKEDEFWEIFSLFLKHKGFLLSKRWV